MKIKVGLTGDQKVEIYDRSVDPVHAFVEKAEDGKYIIEDNNSSTGVYVAGLRIRRKKVDETTTIRLGNSYTTNVHSLLNPPKKLSEVWEKYVAEKCKINSRAQFWGNMRMFSVPAGIIITTLCNFFFPGDPIARNIASGISGILTVLLFLISLFKTPKLQKENVTKLAVLNNKFKSDYVCPKCHCFLGYDTPYSELHRKGCPNIKCGHPL